MSFQNAQEPLKNRHFGVFDCLSPSDASPPIDRLERLLSAFDNLVCCDHHKRLWWDWLMSGRFGADLPAALEQLVVELAMQHGEVAL